MRRGRICNLGLRFGNCRIYIYLEKTNQPAIHEKPQINPYGAGFVRGV